jgi:hypothetical protein
MAGLAVILEDDLDEIESYQPIKGLSRALGRLNEIADEIGVARLSEFAAGEDESFDRSYLDEIAEQEGWSGSDYSRSGGKDEWYEPDDGLDVVRALQGYIESDPESVKKPEALLGALKALEDVLEIASKHGTRFRLEQDD